jgi:hypothetical protein
LKILIRAAFIFIFIFTALILTGTSKSEPGDFEGIYKVGDEYCRVTPVKMAFEVFWIKSGKSEIYFYSGTEKEIIIFETDPAYGDKPNSFYFNDASMQKGKFVRFDGKELKVEKNPEKSKKNQK